MHLDFEIKLGRFFFVKIHLDGLVVKTGHYYWGKIHAACIQV